MVCLNDPGGGVGGTRPRDPPGTSSGSRMGRRGREVGRGTLTVPDLVSGSVKVSGGEEFPGVRPEILSANFPVESNHTHEEHSGLTSIPRRFSAIKRCTFATRMWV